MAKYYEEENVDGNGVWRFLAVADKPRSVFTDDKGNAGDFPVAHIDVDPPKEHLLFDKYDYDTDQDLGITSYNRMFARMHDQGYSENEIHKAVEEQYNTPQMFYHEPAEVVGMFADPSMRHTVGTLGGLALNQFGKIRSDSALSEHSSRLVKRGAAAGIVEPHPLNVDAAPNFPTGLEPLTEELEVESLTNPTHIMPVWLSEVSRPRVDHARRTVHGMLRPKTSPEQFGPFLPDPQLPGMEDY